MNYFSIKVWGLVIGAAALNFQVFAAPVTDWHTFRNTAATTLANQGTDDPIFGSTAATASTAFLIGYLDSPLSLSNPGDRISFTFGLRFNDAAGMPTGANDQLRFALFDLNGQTRVAADNTATAGVVGQTDNWRGYWFGAGTANTGGSIRERTSGDLNPLANAGTTRLGGPTGTTIAFHSSTNGSGGQLYQGELTLTRTTNGVDLSGFFGGNGTTNLFAFSDTTNAFTANFEAVGFLNGGTLSADQFLLENVTVGLVPVPEPSSLALIALGGIAFCRRIAQGKSTQPRKKRA